VIEIAALRAQLCSQFCDGFRIAAVPDGLSIAAPFEDNSGDSITFFLIEEEDGFRFADDGDYLPRLHASGIDIATGTRRKMLDAILGEADAHLDEDSLEVRSELFRANGNTGIAEKSVKFLSSLIRLRDVALLTRDAIESTFREDVAIAIRRQIGTHANLNFNESIAADLSEFPCDMVVRPKTGTGIAAAVYLATSTERLNEALLLHLEAERKKREDFAVIAMIEEPEMHSISRKKFQRAHNRGLSVSFFRGDEDEAVRRIQKAMRLVV